MTRVLSAVFVASVAAGCASQSGALAVSPVTPSPSVVTQNAVTPSAVVPSKEAPTRREIVKRILSHNVRIFLYDGDKPLKSASGVVVGSEVGASGSGSYILTNAHALDTRGMKAPELRVVIDRPWEDGNTEPMEYLASVAAVGRIPDMDLALIFVQGVNIEPAALADPTELIPGDAVLVAAAPYGRAISLSGGLISHVEWDRKSGDARILKTDAPIAYGSSGGGIYSLETGKLLAIVEGYRTAKIGFDVQKERVSFDVPMPGETFAAPVSKVRAFLQQKGFAHLLDPARPAQIQAASR